jgi:hypothetical protein
MNLRVRCSIYAECTSDDCRHNPISKGLPIDNTNEKFLFCHAGQARFDRILGCKGSYAEVHRTPLASRRVRSVTPVTAGGRVSWFYASTR